MGAFFSRKWTDGANLAAETAGETHLIPGTRGAFVQMESSQLGHWVAGLSSCAIRPPDSKQLGVLDAHAHACVCMCVCV